MPINLQDARPGDILHFRCGGKVTLRNLKDRESRHDGDIYFYMVRVEGYHSCGCAPWSYSNEGQHGEGTGAGEKFPFDIIKIDMKPRRKP